MDELPVITIADAQRTEGAEGSRTPLTFTVSLSAPTFTDVTVDFRTVAGTAVEDNDFSSFGGRLTIPAGETTATISVNAFRDNIDEADEDFFLELRNPQGAIFPDNVLTTQGRGVIIDDDGNDTRPSLLVDDVRIVEGNDGQRLAVFDVQLSRALDSGGNFAFSTREGSATAGEDFRATSGTLNFSAGQTDTSVAVPILGDRDTETTETFSLVVAGNNSIQNDAAGLAGTARILDDDAGSGTQPVISIGDALRVEGSDGSRSTLVFPVELSAASPSDVSVELRSFGAMADAGTDFSQTSDVLTIPAGRTIGLIGVNAFREDEVEPDEDFVLELRNAEGAVFANNALTLQARGVIVDDDSGGDQRPSLMVGDARLAEGNNGQQEAVFDVQLSRPASQSLTFDFTTRDGSAVAGEDFDAVSGSLTFAPGQTEASVAVPVQGDTLVESSENFSLVFTANDGVRNTAEGLAGLGVILDDDAGGGNSPVVTISEGRRVEDSDGSRSAVPFNVHLSAPTASDVTMDFRTFGGSADEDNDFQGRSGSLTITAGKTTGTITVNAFRDDGAGPDEDFVLEVFNLQGAVFEQNALSRQARGIIEDDDSGDQRPSLFVSDVSLREGNDGNRTAVFDVRLSRPTDTSIRVDYTTVADSATPGEDFAPTSGSLTFAPGQTEAGVSVEVFGDNAAETSEQFGLIVSGAESSNVSLGAAGVRGEATILDDDSGGGNVPVLSLRDASRVEGADGSRTALNFMVELSAPAPNDISFDVRTLNGTAESGIDFNGGSNTLTFPAGDTIFTIFVNALRDDEVEEDETFALEISNVQGAVLAGGGNTLTATGTIVDDDQAPPTSGVPAVTVENISVAEPATGQANASFTLSLPSPAGLNVTGDYEILNGSATAGEDFTPANGSFTIAGGSQSTTINVPILADNADEGDETFVLKLSNLSNARFPANVDESFAIGTIEANTGTNQPPSARNDSAQTTAGEAVTIDVLANDSDPDGDSLAVSGVGDAQNGTVEIVSATQRSQLLVRLADISTQTPGTPLANIEVDLTFDLGGEVVSLEDVQSTDGTYSGLRDAIDQTLADQGLDDLNVALDNPFNTVSVGGNTVNLPFTAFEVLVTDPSGAEFTNVTFEQSPLEPVSGGFLVAGNAEPQTPPSAGSTAIRFTPDAGFTGTDSFTHTVSDGNGGTDTATVTVTVTADDNPPAPEDDPPMLEAAPNIGVIALSNTPGTLALAPTLFADILGNTSGRTINLPEGAQAQGLDAGTTVNLEGPAEAFAFVRDGTTLEVRDQDTDALVTRVAVGGAAGSLRFSDGGGEITVSNTQIAFGGALFGADTRIPGAELTLDAGLDSTAAFGATADRARPADVNLILRAQDTTPTALDIDDGIHAQILGSTGERTINVAEGAAVQGLDAGATVNLEEASDAFSFGRNGTTLEIRDGAGNVTAQIAGGAGSSTVRFADGSTELAVDFSAGNLTFAGQSLGEGDSVPGSAAGIDLDTGDTSAPFFESGLDVVDLDALGGSPTTAVTQSAGNGAVRFTDAVTGQSNTEITGFGGDDEIRLSGVSAQDVDVSVTNGNTVLEFDDGGGTTSEITLLGISGFFTDVASFNANPNFGDIMFA